MKLILITFQPFWYDGEKYSTNSNFVNFLLAFKKHFKEIVLLAHIRHTQHEKTYLKDYQCSLKDDRESIITSTSTTIRDLSGICAIVRLLSLRKIKF